MNYKICRHCGSDKLVFEKWIFQGEQQKQFHYIAKCLSCKKRVSLPRIQEVFDLVKDVPWQLSKNAKKKQAPIA